jgi:small subunit ribosomal protein S9
MRKGTGQIHVNHKKCEEYFVIGLQQDHVKAPIELCKIQGVDFFITVCGGGLEGQSIAVRHAISRVLVKEDEERRAVLKEQGFLTRDPRKRERKKYGRAGARKRFQFSKR